MSSSARSHCVVVGVDGSPNSLAALRRAVEEAVHRRATVEAVYVIGPAMMDGKPLSAITPVARSCLRHSVEAVLGVEQAVRVRQRVIAGEPADVLTQLADGADLLVVGAHRDADDARPLRGGTVPAVLASSACEVLVCADHRMSVGHR